MAQLLLCSCSTSPSRDAPVECVKLPLTMRAIDAKVKGVNVQIAAVPSGRRGTRAAALR